MPETTVGVWTIVTLLVLFAVLPVASTGCNSADVDISEDGLAEDENEANITTFQDEATAIVRLEPGQHRLVWRSSQGAIVTYYADIPNLLESGEKIALVLFLHPGTPNGAYNPYFGAQFVDLLAKPSMNLKDALIVAPDCNYGTFANEKSLDEVTELVARISEVYPVDRQRTVVMGYSLGGQGAWYFARNRPDFFRAAIAMASRPPEGFGTPKIGIPVLCIHSLKDEVVGYDSVKSVVDALRNNGSDITFDTLGEASHFEMKLFNPMISSRMEWLKKAWERPAN